MAKKFGKFLLFTAAIGTAAAAAYYYMQKKDAAMAVSDDSDDDYDDFSDDFDEDTEDSRTYVSLNLDNTSSVEAASEENTSAEDDFTPLAEQVAINADALVENSVEEFFDEEDDFNVDDITED